MKVLVSGRRTTISDALKKQAEEKIGALDKFLSGLETAEVHFWEEKVANKNDREVCEVTLQGHGHHVRSKVSAPDGFTAIDLAVDKLERQLRKLKTKLQKRSRMKGAEPIAVPQDLLADPVPDYPIVKNKKFVLTSMEPAQAALQMDLLNHSFYVFKNAETDLTSVLYRREDGEIGLIEAQ